MGQYGSAARGHVLDDQVELWWSRQPRRSLLCYCVSVVLIMALGLGGVGLLSTSTSLSGEWRLGVGTTLCLLALAVLLKQLLSSAIQDMNCVRSRRRIEQLKSGGRADPALILTVGLAVMICGTALICVATVGRESHDGRDMLVSGLLLLAGGSVMALSVGDLPHNRCLIESSTVCLKQNISILNTSGRLVQSGRGKVLTLKLASCVSPIRSRLFQCKNI
uniref:Transmembrane protein 125b n=1 Tax=Cynoglossus semilaevis TaxID=244447 RepID=A0A3P8VR45_CYNSE